MYWYGDHMSGWGYALGIIGMVLFWGVIIVAVVVAVRYLSRDRRERTRPDETRPASQPSGAEEILAERFARGEINESEYHERLDTLQQSRHSETSGTRG